MLSVRVQQVKHVGNLSADGGVAVRWKMLYCVAIRGTVVHEGIRVTVPLAFATSEMT